jgi:hypothetical protein
MRGARLLLGTAVAGSRMAAASDVSNVRIAQRMIDGLGILTFLWQPISFS